MQRTFQSNKEAISHFIFLAILIALFYIPFRSPSYVADAENWIRLIHQMDTKDELFGEMAHFLPFPFLAFIKWTTLSLGLDIHGAKILLTFNLICTVFASFFLGLFCFEVLKSRFAFYFSAFLFCTSLAVWFNWNGELYAGSLAFSTTAFWAAHRKKIILSSVLYALSVLCHLEFAFVLPAILWFCISPFSEEPHPKWKWENIIPFLATSAVLGLSIYAIVGMIIGKFSSFHQFIEHTKFALFYRDNIRSQPPYPIKAIKGLLSAFSVSGLYLGDWIQGRFNWSLLKTQVASLTVPLILGPTIVFSFLGLRARSALVMLFLALIPVHLIFNWKYYPSWIEYHSSSIPALIFILTTGVVHFISKSKNSFHKHFRTRLALSFLLLFFMTNFFGSILPLQLQAKSILKRNQSILELFQKNEKQIALLHCDELGKLKGQFSNMFKIESFVYQPDFSRNTSELRKKILSWIEEQTSNSREVYVMNKSCNAPHWQILAKEIKQPPFLEDFIKFSFSFLAEKFSFQETSMQNFYLDPVDPVNPLSWQKATLYKLIPNL